MADTIDSCCKRGPGYASPLVRYGLCVHPYVGALLRRALGASSGVAASGRAAGVHSVIEAVRGLQDAYRSGAREKIMYVPAIIPHEKVGSAWHADDAQHVPPSGALR